MLDARRICGFIAFVIAGLIGYGAQGLAFFVQDAPGPGLLPYLLAVIIAICGILLMTGKTKTVAPAPTDSPILWRRFLFSVCAMLLYSILVPIAGFLAATFPFLLILSRWWGMYRWRVAALYASIASLAIFVLFDLLLSVPLPRGMWAA